MVLKNDTDETKTRSIKVKLLPNKINNLQLANAGNGISLSEVAATTATLTMPIIKDRQFSITMDSYSKLTLSKCPAWLENFTPPSTRSIPESKKSFTFRLKEDAENFNDTQIVFDNAAGGTGMTVNVTKEYQKPTITFVSSDPTLNSYSSGALNLYQIKSAYYSTATLKVYSLGGSKLQLPAGVEAELTQSDAKEQNYVIKYKITSDNDFSLNDISGGTLYAKNLSDETKSEEVAIIFKSSLPKFTASLSGIDVTSRNSSTLVFYLRASDSSTYGINEYDITLTSPSGMDFYNISSGSSYQSVNKRNTIENSGMIKDTYTLTFTSSTSTNKNIYYINFNPRDNRFPSYCLDEYVEPPIFRGYTGVLCHNKWVSTPVGGARNYSAANTYANVGEGWRLPSGTDMCQVLNPSGGSTVGGVKWSVTLSSNLYNKIFTAGHYYLWTTSYLNNTADRLVTDMTGYVVNNGNAPESVTYCSVVAVHDN